MSKIIPQQLVIITVVTEADEQVVIEVALDINTLDFIQELILALRIPMFDPEGMRIQWRLESKSTYRVLHVDQTLGENQVCDGHCLSLFRDVMRWC